MKDYRRLVILAVAATAMIGAGCAKKKVAAQAPPPPAAPAVTAARAPQSTTPVRAAASTTTPAPVAQQPSGMPSAQTRARIDTLLSRIEDAYFDYDKHTLRPDAIKALESDSAELRDILKDYPSYKLTIEGHCDERGSAEYNMALGQERADAAKSYLVQVGIPSVQLNTVSFGKEKPACELHDEVCWQKNRRVHIVADSQR